MTKEEAWKIIEECRNWNEEQKSVRLAMIGIRTPADDVFDARREALRQAWKAIGEIPDPLNRQEHEKAVLQAKS